MGGLTAWRPRRRLRAGGAAGARRAGVITAATFAATTAAVVLLAVLSRQQWLQALPPLVLTLPGLYLAWRALPGAGRRRGRGRRAWEWDPADLDVHQVIGGGPMPPYVRRPAR